MKTAIEFQIMRVDQYEFVTEVTDYFSVTKASSLVKRAKIRNTYNGIFSVRHNGKMIPIVYSQPIIHSGITIFEPNCRPKKK